MEFAITKMSSKGQVVIPAEMRKNTELADKNSKQQVKAFKNYQDFYVPTIGQIGKLRLLYNIFSSHTSESDQLQLPETVLTDLEILCGSKSQPEEKNHNRSHQNLIAKFFPPLGCIILCLRNNL